MRLAGQHALITGGGSGIGAAVAMALASEGARLTLVGRRMERLEQVAAALGARHPDLPPPFVVATDVTSREEVDTAFAAARGAHGALTILVNNAGAAYAAPFAELTDEIWRGILAVNAEAVFHCCQAALPDLTSGESGRIVTIASTAGLKGYAYSAAYVAAKHAAVGLMRALAAELARTRVTANAVCPGFTATDMVEEAVSNISRKTGRSEEEARAELAKFNPQGRLIMPEEVAASVLWLCLPDSGSINGQAIAVAGGEVM